MAACVLASQTFLPGWLAGAEKFLGKRGGEWFSGSGVSIDYERKKDWQAVFCCCRQLAIELKDDPVCMGRKLCPVKLS